MQTKRIVGWITVASLVLAVGGLGLARAMDGPDGHRGPGWAMLNGGFGGPGPMRGLLRDLDLTEEQRSQLRNLAKSAWVQSEDRRSELHALRRQIESAVLTNGFNEAEIQGLIDSKGMLLNDMLLDVVRTMAEMRDVLTPEQLKRLAERRAEVGVRHDARKFEHSNAKE
jgi:Spy/CpxP family protein refolding chaperone